MRVKEVVVALLCLAVCSCEASLVESAPEVNEDVLVDVSFSADWDESTRSSISSDMDAIYDFKILAYRNGLLDKVQYVNSMAKAVSLRLVKGAEYGIYALANVGDVEVPSNESELSSFRVKIAEIAELDNGIPMCWSDRHFRVKGGENVLMFFDRLVSELSFSLDPSAMDCLTVTSVRLRQGAAGVTPFGDKSSKVDGTTSRPAVIDGDHASKSDLAVLNAGGSITLYTLENCQGTLLPGNTDPMRKIPDNLSHPEYCTYLEVVCKFRDESVMEGGVTYRLYPGEDSVTNFDLVRNRVYSLTLCLTPGGLKEPTWRVDNKTAYKLALGSWRFQAGLHGPDDLYVGEIARMRVTLLPGLVKMLAGELADCSIRMSSSGVISDAVSIGKLEISGDAIYCDLKAESLTEDPQNRMYLFSPEGKPITDLVNESLKTVAVRKARIRTSSAQLRPVVNGPETVLDVYLVDRAGNNLNSSRSYGFDIGKYSDFAGTVKVVSSCTSGNGSLDAAVASCHRLSSQRGNALDDGPSFRLSASLVNSGSVESVNRELSRLYGAYAASSAKIWDCNLASSYAEGVSFPMSFDIYPIEVWHCGALTKIDGYPRNFSQTVSDYRLVVSNRSEITLEGSVLYTGRHTSSMSGLRNCSDVQFVAGASMPSELVGSMTDFSLEPSLGSSYEACSPVDPSSGVRKEMKCYHVQSTAAYTMSSPYAMRQQVMSYVGSNWYDCQGDFVLTTVGGYPVSYSYSDYYNHTDLSYDQNTLRDRRYVGSRAWGGDGSMVATTLQSGRPLDSVTIWDLMPVHGSQPLSFSLLWDESLGFVLNISGDRNGRNDELLVDVKYEFKASLQWKKNKNAAAVKESYVSSNSISYAMNLSEEKRAMLISSVIGSGFMLLNSRYWHQSCESATSNRYNRFAVFAMPEMLTLTVTIRSVRGAFLPITLRGSSGTLSLQTYTLYTRTADGSYPEQGNMTNPDGSSRGDDSVINHTAAKYSEYTKSTNPVYSYSAVLNGSKTFHRYDR